MSVLSHFGNIEGETPLSPVFQTPKITLTLGGCPGPKLGGCPGPKLGGPITVPSPIIFAGFGDSLNENVERYDKHAVKYSDSTPSRGYVCSIKKLENDMFDEMDREYVTEKEYVIDEGKEVSKDDTKSSWNDGNTGCGCDECFKSCSWPELPNARCTIQKAADISKNEPDDVELKSVHPYSVSILSCVAQFRDKYERNVMFMNDVTGILYEDFMRINHKLGKNAETTSEWICLTGTFMLTNPKFALAYRTVYGSGCCAHVMQHMLVHSENEYLVELLRRLVLSEETCPIRFLEKFQDEQRALYKNLIRF